MVHLVKKGQNIIVSRTFSKVYGLAGLRIGYLLARPDIAKRLNKSVAAGTNVMAIHAALTALEDKDFYQFCLDKNKEAKEHIYSVLDDLKLVYQRSQTNFVFFQSGQDIKELVEKGWTILGEIATMPFIAKASIVKASKPPPKVLFKALNVWHLTVRDPSGISYTFNLHLLNVLKEVGSRLEICHSPTCRKYFVMHRYDQRYCTKGCRSREAMKEWRQKQKAEKSKPKGGAKRGTKRKQ